MRLLYVGGDLGTTGFGTVTRDLIAGLVELGTDVRLLTFDDVVPKDLPQWLTDRLVLIPRPGFWVTLDQTPGGGGRRGGGGAPQVPPAGSPAGRAPGRPPLRGDPRVGDRVSLRGNV